MDFFSLIQILILELSSLLIYFLATKSLKIRFPEKLRIAANIFVRQNKYNDWYRKSYVKKIILILISSEQILWVGTIGFACWIFSLDLNSIKYITFFILTIIFYILNLFLFFYNWNLLIKIKKEIANSWSLVDINPIKLENFFKISFETKDEDSILTRHTKRNIIRKIKFFKNNISNFNELNYKVKFNFFVYNYKIMSYFVSYFLCNKEKLNESNKKLFVNINFDERFLKFHFTEEKKDINLLFEIVQDWYLTIFN